MPDRLLMTPDGLELESGDPVFIGVQCESPFYTESDRMWNLSQIFLYVSLALGGLTTLLAWTLSVLVPPSNFTWRSISILAACAAVMEVPIFLMFESEPCNMDINRQTCSVAVGGYLNITSIVLFVVMTLWTQCLRPPDWTKETKAWRNTDRDVKVGEISIPSGGDSREGTDELSAPPRESSARADPAAFRESPPRAPAYWSAESKRNDFPVADSYEQPPFRQFDQDKQRPAPVVQDKRRPAPMAPVEQYSNVEEEHPKVEEQYASVEEHNQVFHDLEAPVGNSTVVSVTPEEKGEERRSFWAFGRGRWALGGLLKTKVDNEEEHSTATPESQRREIQPITGPFSWDDSEEVEIPGPSDEVNRDTSLLHDEDDESEAYSEGVEVEEKKAEEEPRKSAAEYIASLKNRLRRAPREEEQRSAAREGPAAKKKAIKVTIICPDGSEEKKKLKTRDEQENPTPFDEQMDNAAASQNRSVQKGARDYVLTHSISRTSTTRRGEEDRSSATPKVGSSSPVRVGLSSRTEKQGDMPLESLAIPPKSRTVSYDAVSEMTPGETDISPEETMAILEDLARLEN